MTCYPRNHGDDENTVNTDIRHMSSQSPLLVIHRRACQEMTVCNIDHEFQTSLPFDSSGSRERCGCSRQEACRRYCGSILVVTRNGFLEERGFLQPSWNPGPEGE